MYDYSNKIDKTQSLVINADPSSKTEVIQRDIDLTFKIAIKKLELTSEVHFRDSKDTKDLHVTTVSGTVSV